MIKMIADPEHIYGDHNDRMPAFDPPDNPEAQQLSREKIGMIVDWIREDWPSANIPELSAPTETP